MSADIVTCVAQATLEFECWRGWRTYKDCCQRVTLRMVSAQNLVGKIRLRLKDKWKCMSQCRGNFTIHMDNTNTVLQKIQTTRRHGWRSARCRGTQCSWIYRVSEGTVTKLYIRLTVCVNLLYGFFNLLSIYFALKLENVNISIKPLFGHSYSPIIQNRISDQ